MMPTVVYKSFFIVKEYGSPYKWPGYRQESEAMQKNHRRMRKMKCEAWKIITENESQSEASKGVVGSFLKI